MFKIIGKCQSHCQNKRPLLLRYIIRSHIVICKFPNFEAPYGLKIMC